MKGELVFYYGNLIEAFIWFGFALRYGLKARNNPLKKPQRPWFGRAEFGCGVFALFGISDLVEMQTGGWWKPWWLLLLKGLCVLGIAMFAWSDRPS